MRSRPQNPRPHVANAQGGIKPVIIAVGVVALLINVLAVAGSQLWVSPDASYYVALAGGIADHLDFHNELFLIRPPGYPLMLAAIFALFGPDSATAIHVVQHAMVVAIAVLTAGIGWHITCRRSVSLIAGIMCASSLQLLAFANLIIAEVPFTLTLVASVYFLVKYHRLGGPRDLALASLLAGLGYLIRPIGMSVVALCVFAAAHRAWTGCATTTAYPNALSLRSQTLENLRPRRVRRSAIAVLSLAIIPAMCITLPVMAFNRRVQGADLSSSCAGVALYHRLAWMDGLDSSNSAALADIRAVVGEAIELGQAPPDTDYRKTGSVWRAYKSVRGVPLAEASLMMGEAARDLAREHPGWVLERTVRYALWMLMVPDSFYRFHPGGASGMVTPTGESVRNTDAEIFDVATYQAMLRGWIEPYGHYLTLRTDAKVSSPMWRGLARWYYRNIEKGPPLTGLGDSAYEEFTWLCLLGALASLGTRERMTWLLVGGVIMLQILPSAALAGPTPRYAVPIKPLMLIYAALLMVMGARALKTAISLYRAPRRSQVQRRARPASL